MGKDIDQATTKGIGTAGCDLHIYKMPDDIPVCIKIDDLIAFIAACKTGFVFFASSRAQGFDGFADECLVDRYLNIFLLGLDLDQSSFFYFKRDGIFFPG